MMKHFRKKGFWVFYFAMVLAGTFIIVALGLQNQSPGIHNVSAQVFTEGLYTSNTLYSYGNISQGAGYGISPQNVLFAPTSYNFPGDIAVQAAFFPGDIIFPGGIKTDGSGGTTKLRTIMTCSGCTQTMSTCDWNCGVTFSQCGTRAGQGSILGLTGASYTSGICPTSATCGNSLFGGCSGGSYTFGTCPSTDITTLITCSGGIFCGRGGNTTFTTCGGGLSLGCSIIGDYTLTTCNPLSCTTKPRVYGIKGIDETPYPGIETIGATRALSCGTFMMHATPGLPSGYSSPPAL